MASFLIEAFALNESQPDRKSFEVRNGQQKAGQLRSISSFLKGNMKIPAVILLTTVFFFFFFLPDFMCVQLNRKKLMKNLGILGLEIRKVGLSYRDLPQR